MHMDQLEAHFGVEMWFCALGGIGEIDWIAASTIWCSTMSCLNKKLLGFWPGLVSRLADIHDHWSVCVRQRGDSRVIGSFPSVCAAPVVLCNASPG